MRDKIEELSKNQNVILEAVQNLNERLKAIEENLNEGYLDDVKEIVDSQAVIDEIIVQNSDDIALIKKAKEKNDDLIQSLDTRIDILDKEVNKRCKEFKDLTENKNDVIQMKMDEKRPSRCKYYNRGYCKKQRSCSYSHSQSICKFFLEEGKCFINGCESRHPKNCKFWERGYCFRNEQCAFMHREYRNIIEEKNKQETHTCENCKDKVFQYYYCQFCSHNYCTKCTIDEAHDVNYNSETNIVRCEQIHEIPQNDELEASNTDLENIHIEIKDNTNSQMVVENSVKEEN